MADVRFMGFDASAAETACPVGDSEQALGQRLQAEPAPGAIWLAGMPPAQPRQRAQPGR